MSSQDWDQYFMKMAFLVASKSKDRSMKCGCVLVGEGHTVLTTGYNGFPRGIDDTVDDRHDRPEKYFWTEHAERNSIYNASRNGIKTLGSRAYITSFPCVDCGRALVQSGIASIVIPTKETDPFFNEGRWDDWAESFAKSKEILLRGGVVLMEILYGV